MIISQFSTENLEVSFRLLQ